MDPKNPLKKKPLKKHQKKYSLERDNQNPTPKEHEHGWGAWAQLIRSMNIDKKLELMH